MECIVSHPDLQGLRRWMLATQDVHGLYAKFGFSPLKSPERWMEIHHADIYASLNPEAVLPSQPKALKRRGTE
jgi:hypothetical protein